MRCAALLLLAAPASASAGWEAWKALHGKSYGADEGRRAAVFAANMEKAAELAKGEPLATFGDSPYADLTEEEFVSYHAAASFFASANATALPPAEVLPELGSGAGSVDWRAKGAVTPVKDQKQCGSCWAFSTTGNIEGQAFLAGHPLTPLSEQQLISCDKGYGDMGCMGGLPSNAYKYVAAKGGLESEADYPTVCGSMVCLKKCKFDKSKVATQISSGIAIQGKESQMLAWLTQNGPISIGVNAAGSAWQLYKSGIMSNCKASQPDHGVLIVGYGEENSKPYWIIKNSWNSKWGEKGYLRLAYGSNQCNIESTPTSAVVPKATEWEAFKAQHGKSYGADEARRASIFSANMQKARELAESEPLATFGASPYADLTEEEFASYHAAASFFASANATALPPAEVLPRSAELAAEAGSVDWRAKGAVTPVKDQKQCGSCWAFSTTGNIEGQAFLAGHPLTPLSEQQLISCDKGYGDMGCMGGLPSNAYKYVAAKGGLESEADYPLTCTLPLCLKKCTFDQSKVATQITGGIAIKSDEAQMLAWLTKSGPISIGVNAAGSAWQLYKSGIMSGCKASQPDHGVLIVGYGEENSKPYWIIKNSWNAKWGEKGYLRLAYGSNQCNIESTPTSAVVA